jgi:hypothetical protein
MNKHIQYVNLFEVWAFRKGSAMLEDFPTIIGASYVKY